MRRHLPLILILPFAAVLRLIFLGQIPAGFSPDEASQGYSAYSLIQTGKDEWSQPWPLTGFRSFLDYKAPLQTYLMIPSIALLGLSPFSVRLPSAIIGILAVLVVYFLGNQLFPKSKFRIGRLELSVGHLAAFFLAISPWHLQFSRTALEVNITSLLFPLGLLFFLRAEKEKSLYFLAVICWGLNLYSYHAAKLFEPVFITLLVLNQRRELAKLDRKLMVKILLLAAIFVVPLLASSIFGTGSKRGGDLLVTNLSKENVDQISLIQYNSPLKSISPQVPRLFANKATLVIDQFASNLLSYTSPSFWFTEGGREITYSVLPGTGLLYIFLLPLIAFGLYRLVKDKSHRLPLLLFWFIAAILPAALTKEGYRPNRVGSLLVFWELIAAYGLCRLWEDLPSWRRLVLPFSFFASILVLFYLNAYFFEYRFRYPTALSAGYRELVSALSVYPSEKTILIDQGNNSQTFVAFYNKMDPHLFQEYSAAWSDAVKEKHPLYLDQLEEYHLANYVFKNFNPSVDLVSGKVIAIPASEYQDPYRQFVRNIIYYPDGSVAFYILEKDG